MVTSVVEVTDEDDAANEDDRTDEERGISVGVVADGLNGAPRRARVWDVTRPVVHFDGKTRAVLKELRELKRREPDSKVGGRRGRVGDRRTEG